MPRYRIYSVEADGHFGAPARIVDCANESEALDQARRWLGKEDLEIWTGGSLIVRLAGKDRQMEEARLDE
jgi:hypothetical protein